MFDFIIHSSVFVKTILMCSLLGILSWGILEISYKSMIKASAQIGKTKRKWLVSLRKKYEDYHNMDIKVNNVTTFVDRLFRKKKVCGFTCAFWLTLERMTIAGCAIAGAAGALFASQQGKGLSEVMVTYLTGITAACVLILFDTFLRADEKKHIVITNMNDYLENVLENTISGREAVEEPEVRKEHNRRLARYAEENQENRKKKKKERLVSPEEEQLLEDVLQEFFA